MSAVHRVLGGNKYSSSFNRNRIGTETIKIIGGDDYDRLTGNLYRLSPDFYDLLIEGGYGDILGRKELSLKDREVATVAILTTQGNAPSAFKFHCAGMLNTGWEPQEVVETVLHALVYAGFPAVQTALQLVREVFHDERKVEFEPSKASKTTGRMGEASTFKAGTGDVSLQSDHDPALAIFARDFANGEIWNRPGLSGKHRQLATLAMVITKGNQTAAMQLHLEQALRLGWTRLELTELLMQMTAYVGWPIVLATIGPALEVFDRIERYGLPDIANDEPSPRREHATEFDRSMRSERGLNLLDKLDPEHAFVHSFDDIAPDFGSYFVDFVLSDVVSRAELDLKTRVIISIAVLAASGRVMDRDSLKFHVKAALNLGATRKQVNEAILQILPFAGFVTAKQALSIAAEVFTELENPSREILNG